MGEALQLPFVGMASAVAPSGGGDASLPSWAVEQRARATRHGVLIACAQTLTLTVVMFAHWDNLFVRALCAFLVLASLAMFANSLYRLRDRRRDQVLISSAVAVSASAIAAACWASAHALPAARLAIDFVGIGAWVVLGFRSPRVQRGEPS